MKKVKQIPLDKVLPLLQLGMPAACWSRGCVAKKVISSVLEGVAKSTDYYAEWYGSAATMIKSKALEEEGSLVCYTLVDSDED